MKTIEFYVPYTLVSKIRVLLEQNKRPQYVLNQLDKYYYFLSCLYIQSILNKKYEQGDYISMNTTVMEKLMGVRYVMDIKHFFEEHNIIQTDNHYIEGEKSIGYRLNPEYQVTHRVVLPDDYQSTFIQKLINQNAATIANMDAITRYTYFQLNELSIDRVSAERYVQVWYNKNILFPSNKLVKKHQYMVKEHGTGFTFEKMMNQMMESYMFQIKAIDERLWLPTRDRKGRRIHSFISVLWKELRQFLFLKDKPSTQLIALDCSNSQPYTLVKILLEYFDGCELTDDVQHYIDLVCSGELYTFMCNELGITDAEEIASFKTDMFSKVMYCPNYISFYTDESKIFRKHFPTVYQIIMHEKKYKYQQLSIEMQRVETSAVLDGTLTYFMQKYQDKAFFASIHDSIVCEPEYEDEVREMMLHYYTAVVGRTPHIKAGEKLNRVMELKKVA